MTSGNFPPSFRPQWQSLRAALMAGRQYHQGWAKRLWKSLGRLWTRGLLTIKNAQQKPWCNAISQHCITAFAQHFYKFLHKYIECDIFFSVASSNTTLSRTDINIRHIRQIGNDWKFFDLSFFVTLLVRPVSDLKDQVNVAHCQILSNIMTHINWNRTNVSFTLINLITCQGQGHLAW